MASCNDPARPSSLLNYDNFPSKNGKRGRKKIIMFEIPRVASASSGPHVMRARKKTFLNLDACVVTFLTPLPFLGGFGAYILFEYFPLFPFGEPCGGPQLPPRKYLGRRDKGEGADIFRLLRWVSAIPLLPSPLPLLKMSYQTSVVGGGGEKREETICEAHHQVMVGDRRIPDISIKKAGLYSIHRDEK